MNKTKDTRLKMIQKLDMDFFLIENRLKSLVVMLLMFSGLFFYSCKEDEVVLPSNNTTVIVADSTILTGMSVYNALDYGVKPDAIVRINKLHSSHVEPISGTDNAPALNKLIEKVQADGGGVVVLPKGDYLIGSSIILRNGVSLMGVGRAATRIILGNGANTHMIVSYSASNAEESDSQMNMIAHLTLEGNRWFQKLAYHRADVEHVEKHAHGILVLPGSNTSTQNKAQHFHVFKDLYINNVYGTGVFTRSALGEHYVQSIHARRCGNGFVIGAGSKVTDCVSDEAEFFGFRILHGYSSYVGCKAFRSGACVAVGVDRAIADMRRTQPGYVVSGEGGKSTLTSCVAQNNGGEGFIIDTSGLVATGLQADANNMLATDPPRWFPRPFEFNDDSQADRTNLIAKTDFAGIKFTKNAKKCIVDFMSQTSGGQEGASYGFQHHAMEIETGAAQNSIKCNHFSEIPQRKGPAIKAGYQPTGINTIEVNGYLLESNTTSYAVKKAEY